jgi:ATP/maltotriose-dependent transcriptional regulator MalT
VEEKPLTDLLLLEGEQAAIRAVLAVEPAPGAGLPAVEVLSRLLRVIRCDGGTIERRDASGAVLGSVSAGHWTGGTAAEVMVLAVATSKAEVVRLRLARSRHRFGDQDRALFVLLTPAVERLLRSCRWEGSPEPLTLAELRVLRLVALGLSNAEVAARLGIASCTVGKHLEHAYRKLGVTNRWAALREVGISLGD